MTDTAKTWYWDASANRYRDASGKFVAYRTVETLRNNLADLGKARVAAAAAKFSSGESTAAQFKEEMKGLIKIAYGAEYVFGKGGLKNMTQADWGRVGSEVKRQYAFLEKFIEAASTNPPTLSEKMIAHRASMYMDGAIQAHGRGLASAWDVAPPGVPADGGTECGNNCRCNLRFERESTGVVMYWETVGDDRVCEGCETRGAEWNPYKFKATTATG